MLYFFPPQVWKESLVQSSSRLSCRSLAIVFCWLGVYRCMCVCVCVHVCVRPVGLRFFLPFFYSGGARNMRRLEPLVSSLQTDNLEDRAWDALRDRTVLDPCDPASL